MQLLNEDTNKILSFKVGILIINVVCISISNTDIKKNNRNVIFGFPYEILKENVYVVWWRIIIVCSRTHYYLYNIYRYI